MLCLGSSVFCLILVWSGLVLSSLVFSSLVLCRLVMSCFCVVFFLVQPHLVLSRLVVLMLSCVVFVFVLVSSIFDVLPYRTPTYDFHNLANNCLLKGLPIEGGGAGYYLHDGMSTWDNDDDEGQDDDKYENVSYSP